MAVLGEVPGGTSTGVLMVELALFLPGGRAAGGFPCEPTILLLFERFEGVPNSYLIETQRRDVAVSVLIEN